jgi:glycosyltransferase involved in cell wall biosynthesis
MVSDTWTAGEIYSKGLLDAIRFKFMDNVRLVALEWHSAPPTSEHIRELVDEVVCIPCPTRWTPTWLRERGASMLLNRDPVASKFLESLELDVITFGRLPRGCVVPYIAWLPDFQHVHYPEMFSPQERATRDQTFRKTLHSANRVILISDSVRKDLIEFAPEFQSKARVLRPVCSLPASTYDSNPVEICKLYRLPEKFLYLCGQFWKHKNHNVVFRALKILRDRGSEPFLVCTGFPGDSRHPDYFSEVLQLVSKLGLRHQVAILGIIPRDHVLGLIRQSLCVLAPSLFEGFGMTVDEARSVGKFVLASDIPAHREQTPPWSAFFDPRDEEELAERIQEVWMNREPGPSIEEEAEARQTQSERLSAYATDFMRIVRDIAVR